MSFISEKQLAIISADLTDQGIVHARLKMELLDHLCCMIEDRMQTGEDFETAYQEVKSTFGTNGLRELQAATIDHVRTIKRNTSHRVLTFAAAAAVACLLLIAPLKNFFGGDQQALLPASQTSTLNVPVEETVPMAIACSETALSEKLICPEPVEVKAPMPVHKKVILYSDSESVAAPANSTKADSSIALASYAGTTWVSEVEELKHIMLREIEATDTL